MDLLIATGNIGKANELIELLAGLRVRLRRLDEFPDIRSVVESGATFAENAELKATGYAVASGIWALADDSGLEVDALDGAPGVLSARYAGGKSDGERLRRLLREIEHNKNSVRTARFVCAMAIADESGQIRYRTEAICEGTIAETPRGIHGFGYDPIFIPEGFDMTFGEIPEGIKREISHRAKAIREILRYLLDFTA